jgi:hypothetical protein
MGGETKTTTENRIPAYQEEYLKGTVFPFATNLATQPVTPYGGPMTAPLSALSGEAADVYRRMGEAPDIAGRTAANFAAMKETVLDPQIAAMARQRAQEMTGQEGDIIRSGAFDASRRGVYEAEKAAAYEAGVSNLMAQGYSQAQAAAMAQAQAEQAGLGASAAGLGGLGAQETDLAFRNIAMPYQEFVRQQQMPLSTLQGLAGVPIGAGGSTVQRQPYDWFGALTGAGQAASMWM